MEGAPCVIGLVRPAHGRARPEVPHLREDLRRVRGQRPRAPSVRPVRHVRVEPVVVRLDLEGLGRVEAVLEDGEDRPLTRISTFVDTTAQAHHARFLETIGDVDAMPVRTGCPPIFQYPVNRLHGLASRDPQLPRRGALDEPTLIQIPNKPIASPKRPGGTMSATYAAEPVGLNPVENPWKKRRLRKPDTNANAG